MVSVSAHRLRGGPAARSPPGTPILGRKRSALHRRGGRPAPGGRLRGLAGGPYPQKLGAGRPTGRPRGLQLGGSACEAGGELEVLPPLPFPAQVWPHVPPPLPVRAPFLAETAPRLRLRAPLAAGRLRAQSRGAPCLPRRRRRRPSLACPPSLRCPAPPHLSRFLSKRGRPPVARPCAAAPVSRARLGRRRL